MTLFRKVPPWSCILEILSLLNISSEFPTTFQKTDLRSENFIACSGILEPYYLPCKVTWTSWLYYYKSRNNTQ